MTLYTKLDCPLCKVAKLKLTMAGIEYEESHNMDKMLELNIRTLPVLELNNGDLLKFGEIMEYVKGFKN